ncbi:MAG: DUF4097 family beta strand repeat-containing protein [Longimicrobiales bacterium]
MMTRTNWRALVPALAMLVSAPTAGRAQDDFLWRGRVAAGRAVEVKGVNGAITASPAAGDEIEIRASKHARRDDPGEVRIEVVPHDGGVTICAVYPTPARARQPNECAPGGAGRMNVRNNDVTVDFDVLVPANVRLVGKTVNGDVEARDLRGDASINTVNGSVRVITAGHADARTVNGNVHVEMGRADWDGSLVFKTVNGSITVVFPGDLGADLTARTVNGSIESDFPMSVVGRISRQRLSATIGSGGRPLELETVNGDIRLRRR